jgi:hypothetical protein
VRDVPRRSARYPAGIATAAAAAQRRTLGWRRTRPYTKTAAASITVRTVARKRRTTIGADWGMNAIGFSSQSSFGQVPLMSP